MTPLSAAHPLNDSTAALIAAQREPLRKQKGERDTEFVKRIVQAYHQAASEIAPAPVDMDDPNWLPTPENINRLPEPFRNYIHRLITNTDPAGMVLENLQLRQQASAVEAMFKAAELDAARYRWLREGNAYVPEELGVTGGDELDQICDGGIAGQ